MTTPTLTKTGQRLYDALSPLAAEDEANGYALAHYLSALASMFDEVADLSRDQDDGSPGWAPIFDPASAPARYLPWLAQFVGVQLPPNLDEAGQRLRIAQTDGFKRGTPDAIKGAARQHLIGPDGTGASATVFLIERHGSPYRLTVTTLASETPDAAKVEAAIREQKPAGLVLLFSVIAGGDFQTLRDTHTDFAEIAADFTDFDEVRSDPSLT